MCRDLVSTQGSKERKRDKTEKIKFSYFSRKKNSAKKSDSKPGLVPDLVPGIQGEKVLDPCVETKSLKFVLIDSKKKIEFFLNKNELRPTPNEGDEVYSFKEVKQREVCECIMFLSSLQGRTSEG
jgi:hypothetical protein